MNSTARVHINQRGIAVCCTMDGCITRTLGGYAEWFDAIKPGTYVQYLVDPTDYDKVMLFIEAVEQEKFATNWPLSIWLNGTLHTLFFTAAAFDDQLLVLAADSSATLNTLLHEIERRHHDTEDAVALILDQSRVRFAATSDTLDEPSLRAFSQLNNELAVLHRELSRKNAELEHLQQEKQQILAMLAHDMRNSLAVINMYCQLADGGSTEIAGVDAQDCMRVVMKNSNYLLSLISDLLELTHLSSERPVLNYENVDIVECTQQMLTEYGKSAAEKHIKISLNAALPSLSARLDAVRFEQVLSNLISNAIKYSYPDTHITVGLEKRDSFAVLTVTDQGQGIAEHELGSIFKPYFRASARPTGNEKSTGLGLAIVERLIHLLHGRIEVRSTVGKGTQFTVFLPLSPDTPAV